MFCICRMTAIYTEKLTCITSTLHVVEKPILGHVLYVIISLDDGEN